MHGIYINRYVMQAPLFSCSEIMTSWLITSDKAFNVSDLFANQRNQEKSEPYRVTGYSNW